tara:strand:+ start:1514 stop:2113 length:600 start_codon:yes stop_codon:yes gene_type:complete
MERNINKKVEMYNKEYKEFIKQQFVELDTALTDNIDSLTKQLPVSITIPLATLNSNIHTELMDRFQRCYDYKKLILNKEDFQKRKRIKNVVSLCERCCACRANKEQCTRRKKEGSDFCGTHIKGTPHGVIKDKTEVSVVNKKNTVWAQDIKGIMYYIDDDRNVYSTEDVMGNKVNPRIIANYEKKIESGEPEYYLINYN